MAIYGKIELTANGKITEEKKIEKRETKIDKIREKAVKFCNK